ncbi:MAG: peptidoglycan DD-metalloendopeptidase family protein [Pseudomonadota bacterium]
MKRKHWRSIARFIASFALSLLVSLLLGAHASKTNAISGDKKQTLDDLRGRIEKLNQDLAKSEESRTEVTDQLKISEKAISEVNRNLMDLGKNQSAIGRELTEVEQRIKNTRTDIANEEALRDKLIRHQYMYGNTDAMRLMLSGQDVSAVERQLAYLGYVTRSRIATIDRLKKSIAVLALLEADALEKQLRLAANADEQKRARLTLVSERLGRQKVLNRIRADINKNKREVGRLQRDENRLTKLVEQIAIELARKITFEGESGTAQRKRVGKKDHASRIRKAVEPINEVADSGYIGRAFASLRGKLKLPVKGELAGRYGAQREEGGVTWRGLFIRAGDGQVVRAVADGRVVYADWLRGYGNLVIVDHGSGFLSLYGHNESLVKQVGDDTSAGEVIASVGSTGGALESGVYFELRQDGKPFDPMRWVAK